MHSASSSKFAHTKRADTTKVQDTARVRVPLLKLPAVLRTSDLVVLTIITVVLLPKINATSSAGSLSLLFWLFGFITFMLPQAFLGQWLVRRLPGKGSPYVWARIVYGPTLGFLITFMGWCGIVMINATMVEDTFASLRFLLSSWFDNLALCLFLMLAILGLAAALACIPLRRLTKWLFVVCICYVVSVLLLTLGTLWWGWHAHAFGWVAPTPSREDVTTLYLHTYSLTLVGFTGLIFPLFLGQEVQGGNAGLRRASNYVWWGAGAIFIIYLLCAWSLLTISHFASVNDAAGAVFTLLFGPPGRVIALSVIASAHLLQTMAITIIASRLLVTLAQHRRIPRSIATLNRVGVPVMSIAVQALAVALVICASILVVVLFRHGFSFPSAIFEVISSILYAVSELLFLTFAAALLAIPFFLLFRTGNRSKRTWKNVLVLLCAVLHLVSAGMGIWITVTISWIPQFLSNDSWRLLVLFVTCSTLIASFLLGEVPRVRALFDEERFVSQRERALRKELEQSYQRQQELMVELEKLYREQEQAALTDPISGLPNHRALMTELDKALERSRRTGVNWALVFADLDHFKSVNDQWGHRVGDLVLHELGRRLRSGLRANDIASRYGGEEFALIMADIAHPDEAVSIVERLRQAVATQPFCWEHEGEARCITITISLGIALYPQHGSSREQLIERADFAMYQAKSAGRNRVCLAK
ncbi:hypothetical protein KSC_099000 [Ktedonobacter sp. SOSP1-52]|uniref:amino acid permease n=1 Tax=Ktedonobacter sp. SOSP1-52 TaxID=2778366 RepID=UPI001914DE23|nr:amino acid permease [Ktedonobacter sp. SOSP1-52]GHO71008.1 hypothetical protein KSC_099000 [Ktedonobacter sp. SOSP1-52]